MWQKQGRPECGWEGNDVGAMTYSFHVNGSPEMSCAVLECDVVMLQNYILTTL